MEKKYAILFESGNSAGVCATDILEALELIKDQTDITKIVKVELVDEF